MIKTLFFNNQIYPPFFQLGNKQGWLHRYFLRFTSPFGYFTGSCHPGYDSSGKSAITPQDITSRFTREEFDALALPYLRNFAEGSEEHYVTGLEFHVAYQTVHIEYDKLERQMLSKSML